MHCTPSTPDLSQLKRSQSALQIWKGGSDIKLPIHDVAMKEPVATPAVYCSPKVSATSQLMRSQSPLGIWKGDDDAQLPVVEDAQMVEAAPPPAIWSPPSVPGDSPLKRSQSALQILKMGRVDSCGGLAEMIAPKAPRMGIA